MTSKDRRPGAATPGTVDDPWERLARANQAEARGEEEVLSHLVGDTGRLLRHERTEVLEVQGEGPSTEILQLVTQSLASEPERPDLWMMRFEVQKALGLKADFARALTEAFRNPRLLRALDWAAIRALWADLAPGEAPPEGVRLPESPAPASPAPEPARARDRRFSDVATQLAGRELAVLARAWAALRAQPGFLEAFAGRLAPLIERPTPLQFAETLTRIAGNPQARIFLKREDRRAITPEQENAAAQCHIAALLGRSAVITGNDVDAHALAVAEAAPRFGLHCTVAVRPGDFEQRPAVMAQLIGRGAKVRPMEPGGQASGDPRVGAVRLWLEARGAAHLVLSLGTGPSPYPAMVNDLQSLLGRETVRQLDAASAPGRARTLVAAVQSEADSIGFVLPHLRHGDIELAYAEPEGGTAAWRPSARLRAYNGALREHAWLRGLDRIAHVAIPDAQALGAQLQLERAEQVKPSVEDARALALTLLLTPRDRAPRDYVVLVG